MYYLLKAKTVKAKIERKTKDEKIKQIYSGIALCCIAGNGNSKQIT